MYCVFCARNSSVVSSPGLGATGTGGGGGVSIGGSGGLFGLDEVVRFTHVVENLLDLLRNGTLYVQFLSYPNGHVWADLHTGAQRAR